MTTSQTARIVSLQLCVGHEQPMKSVDSANVITGFGIEGDRHAATEGPRRFRQILLMDEETLEGFGLAHGQIRENVTISGFDLSGMQRGQKVTLGDDVVLEITGDCDPCQFIDDIREGMRAEMEGKRGMLAFVTNGGTIKKGDSVSLA